MVVPPYTPEVGPLVVSRSRHKGWVLDRHLAGRYPWFPFSLKVNGTWGVNVGSHGDAYGSDSRGCEVRNHPNPVSDILGVVVVRGRRPEQ